MPVKFEPIYEILTEDQLPPIKPKPVPKRLEAKCRGKSIQIATCIEGLAKAIAEQNQGYSPFFLLGQQDFHKQGSVAQFDVIGGKIRGIGVYPSDPPSMRGQLRLPNLHVGWIDLDEVGQDAKGADLCQLVFKCQEREWLRFVDTWNTLVDELRRVGVLVGHRASTPKQTPAEVSPEIVTESPVAPKKGGRPPLSDDDWAFEQIYVNKRPWGSVYEQWLRKIPLSRRNRFTDPVDAFAKAMSRRYKKWDGRNM